MEAIAIKMGTRLGMTQVELDRLRLLTKFHDIGKVGIPDSILKKEGPLNDEEWKIMRTHTNIGERIARESAELEAISPLILRHHERWDSHGYPLGIAREEIPHIKHC
jgi:HD-GYP domain-containing protein (c-di-GMP phosphodiesterase class II)